MRHVFTLGLAALCGTVGLVVAIAADDDDDKPKHTIKEVMKLAHKKETLLDKVKEGKAGEEDKKKLLELYEALAENKPPKGEQESWDKLTEAMVTAAKDVVDGKDGAIDALKKATMCGDCHKAHKGG